MRTDRTYERDENLLKMEGNTSLSSYWCELTGLMNGMKTRKLLASHVLHLLNIWLPTAWVRTDRTYERDENFLCSIGIHLLQCGAN